MSTMVVCDGNEYQELLPGVLMRTLSVGSKTHMVEFRLEQGRAIPTHAHPHEQIGYLVSGTLALTVAENKTVYSPGGSWIVAGGVEHSAEVVEDAVVVEVFSPTREDYL